VGARCDPASSARMVQRGRSELGAEFPAAGLPFSLICPSRGIPAPHTRLVMFDKSWGELATASDEDAWRKRRTDALAHAAAFIPH
jgi:hypothetical protein